MSNTVDKIVEAKYEKVPGNENVLNEKSDVPDSYGYGVRHVQILLGFISLSVGFIARAHIGVSVVAMTNSLDIHSHSIHIDLKNSIIGDLNNNTTTWEDVDYENETLFDNDYDMENDTIDNVRRRSSPENVDLSNSIYRKYDWPKSTQEMVLGAFFLGYTIMMIPMGIVSHKYGGKLPMQIALLVNGIASLVTPWMASWGGWKAVCMCRVSQGLSQAGYYPGLQTFVSRWSAPSERGRFFSWAFTGTTFGTVLAFQIAGLLAAIGWPLTFWVTGSLSLLALLLLTVFGAASPAEHKTISDLEKKFITGKTNAEKNKNLKVPVKAVLTNKHLWGTWCTHVGSGVAFVFFFSQAPTYIHYILDIDVKKSGLLSSLPYIASFITSLLYGWVSDFLTNRNILSLKNARRLSNSYATFGMAICFIGVSFTRNVGLAIFGLVISMAFQTALHTGWMVNYIDLSPTFSGSLMSFGNTMSCFAVLSLPFIVSFIVTDVTNQMQWRIIFFMMAGIVVTTNLIFVILMSADTQPFDNDGFEETETEEQTHVKTS